MRIAIIGRGNIGATIGSALARAGQNVLFGSRHPNGDDEVGISEAIDGADAVLLAIPSGAIDDFLAEHATEISGKLVIDATNRMGAATADAADAITSAAPEVRYVRAFNSLGWENFGDPVFDGEPADLFFSAPRDDRATVEEIISAVGLRPAYLGEGQHRAVDAALPLWFALAQERGNRRIAFRVLEK